MGPAGECAWDRTYCGGTESRLCRFVFNCAVRTVLAARLSHLRHNTVATFEPLGSVRSGMFLLSHAHSHPPVHELQMRIRARAKHQPNDSALHLCALQV